MTSYLKLSVAGLALLAAPLTVTAEEGHHHARPEATADEPASTRELRDANARMHKEMDIPYSGDADIDFLRGMIAHHQGAVDMARVQLKYGKDAQVRRLSQDIIRAQAIEIRWMQRWLGQLEDKQKGFHDSAWAGSKTWLNER